MYVLCRVHTLIYALAHEPHPITPNGPQLVPGRVWCLPFVITDITAFHGPIRVQLVTAAYPLWLLSLVALGMGALLRGAAESGWMGQPAGGGCVDQSTELIGAEWKAVDSSADDCGKLCTGCWPV